MLQKAKKTPDTLTAPAAIRPARRSFPSVGLVPVLPSDGPSSSEASPTSCRKRSSDKRKISRVHLGRIHFFPDQEEELDPTEPVSLYDFFIAASGGKIKTVRKFLDDGGDVNSVDSCQRTALHRAALYEHPVIVSLLIERGAKVNAADKLCNTPLHWACRGSNLEVVQTLLANNANVNKKDQLQNAPLHVATRVGFMECVNYLLECGAKINERDCEGDTPIHDAIRLGRPKVVKTLILHGANMELKNQERKTAADMIQAWFNNTKDAILYAENERKRKGIDTEKLVLELEKQEGVSYSEFVKNFDEKVDIEYKTSSIVDKEKFHPDLGSKCLQDVNSLATSSKRVPPGTVSFTPTSIMTLEGKNKESRSASIAEVSRLNSVADALTDEGQRGLTKMENALPLMQESPMRSRVVFAGRTKPANN